VKEGQKTGRKERTNEGRRKERKEGEKKQRSKEGQRFAAAVVVVMGVDRAPL
jgi:hypothetical protein